MPSTASTTDKPDGVAIDARRLCKTYRDGWIRRRRLDALKDVTFTVRRGEIFGLLGPNGAGKTTFLKILLGIIRKSAGSAQMLGLPAGSREGRQLVGYLPEQLRMPRHLTGYSAMEMYGNLSNLSNREIRARRNELLEMVGLEARAADRVRKYSKGMLQRLGLAQAMLHKPQLLVLDEPTDGLDPRARAEVRGVIRGLKGQGVTIFLNSHILQEVELVCDHVAILDRGVLRYSGSVREIGEFVSRLAGAQGKSFLHVEFKLDGDPEAARSCFDPAHVERLESREGELLVKARMPSQQEIDQTVDQLRARGISLISLAREQVSLEDAFLKIVDENRQGKSIST